MRHFVRILCLFTFCLLLLACATPVHKAMDHLSTGMNKAEVLEIAGNPKRTHRQASRDEWTYVYFVDNREYHRKVYFENNRVTEVAAAVLGKNASTHLDSREAQQYEELVERERNNKKFKPVDDSKSP